MQFFTFPRTALGGLLAIGLCLPVLAQPDEADRPAEASRWGLGLALMSGAQPYRDVDEDVRVLPILSFENRWVRVVGPGVEFKLGHLGPLALGLTARYGMDGYKASDSPVFEGMAKREGSAWLGAKASLRGRVGQLNAEWSADASGNSKGQKLLLGLERRFQLGEIGLSPRLAATWMDRSFVHYYYGVEASEARAGRLGYRPGSTVNTEVGLRLDYRPAPQHLVFADLGATALGDAIKNSPLVDRSRLPSVRLGYLYRF